METRSAERTNPARWAALLARLPDSCADALALEDGGGLAVVNQAFAKLFDMPAAEPLQAGALRAAMARRVAASSQRELLDRLCAAGGSPRREEFAFDDGRAFEATCTPGCGSGEGGRGWHFHEVSRWKGLQAAAEEARRRAAFLAEAGRLLAGSLDYATTLEQVARLALPEFADYCIVDLLDEAGTPRRVAVAHKDPAKAPLADALRDRYPLDPRWPEGIARVLRTERGEFLAEMPDEMIQAIARDPEHLRLLRELGSRSAVCAPMIVPGRLIGGITLLYGVSGRRYTADDVPFAEQLAQRAAAAVENARLYRTAHAAISARDEFLAVASHDLRTPFTSMYLGAQLLLRGIRDGHLGAEMPEQVLERMVRQGHRAISLFDRLLDFSRIQAGALELDLAPVDLAQVARNVVADSRDELERAGCALSLRAGAEVVGRWDRGRVEQVLNNLLANAIKYGEGQPLEVSVEREGPLARLTVVDHGIGIAPEAGERIFGRYERAVSARQYGGVGLGLFIVRRIVEALGGRVFAKSSPGGGASFTVELPVSGPPA